MQPNVISMPRSLGQRSAEASPAILDIACGIGSRCAVRSGRSLLIDRRHAKVWFLMSEPPLTRPRSRPREQLHPKP